MEPSTQGSNNKKQKILHTYVSTFPKGLGQLFCRELKTKCPDLEILWQDSSSIVFNTSLAPQLAVKSLKGANLLCSFLHRTTILPETDFLVYLKKDGIDWKEALHSWRMVYTSKPDPLTCGSEITFRATCERNSKTKNYHKFGSMDAAKAFGAKINDTFHWKPKMRDFDLEVFINVQDENAWMGVMLHKGLLSKTRNRTVLGKTTLNSAVAYLMCSLANIGPGSFVLDPTGGVGTIPIEASQEWSSGLYFTGDNKKKCIDGAIKNIENHAGPTVSCLVMDARYMPFRDGIVDAIITDLPFGKREGSHKINQNLYPKLFKEMERLIKIGGSAILLTLEKKLLARTIEKSKGFKLEETYLVDVGGYFASIYHLRRIDQSDSNEKQITSGSDG